MQILPVLDLMQGQVVRGVGGRRDEYRPVESLLCGDARPTTVARALADLGFRAFYVADLDAIEGGWPAWETYRQLLECGRELWIDAGLTSVRRAREIASYSPGISGIVAGLESLVHPQALGELLAAVGPERLIFSLDLKAGRPVASVGWAGKTPEEIGQAALDVGIRRIIVLDLARVGEGTGVGTEDLCRALRARAPQLDLTAGGGVRSRADLESLAEAGCDAALVASALHDGRLDAGSLVQGIG